MMGARIMTRTSSLGEVKKMCVEIATSTTYPPRGQVPGKPGGIGGIRGGTGTESERERGRLGASI